jgi:hypothetical protein
MQDVEQTIISQYANSPTLVQLIQNFNTYIDPTANLDAFYSLVWNVDTAVGYGLDVWGRIVGVGRVLNLASGVYFGFAEAIDGTEAPFNQAPFFSGGATTGNFALTDESYRTLIFAKALLNITDGSIPSINQILINLFGTTLGNCYVADNQDMTLTYVFAFALTEVQTAIIIQSGVIPRPAGVLASFVVQTTGFYSDGGVLALIVPPAGYPISMSGLAAGAMWSNGGVVSVVPGSTPNPTALAVYFGIVTAAGLLALGGANLPLANPGSGSGQLWNSGGEVWIA